MALASLLDGSEGVTVASVPDDSVCTCLGVCE